jgi:RNA polymerase sigma-70 factor (ECF subfamily)
VDDEALIASLRRGEREAFDAAYARYRARIFGYLARLCGRRELAEDLVQETFLRLVRFAPRLADDTRLDVWLYTVARNLYLSHLRWALVDADRNLSAGRLALDEAHEPSPFDMTLASELERNVERALASLPLTYRDPLVLLVVERVSADDAARILEVSADTLRQRLSRGRKLLADAMQTPTARGARKVVCHEG